MRSLAIVCLLALSQFATAAPFLIADTVAGISSCGVFVDAAPKVTVAVTAGAPPTCWYDLSGTSPGMHWAAMTSISLDDPVWGSQESAMSSPLTFTIPGAPAVNYQGLWWNTPPGSESGWGINVAHQGDTIFATWFSYDATGTAWWLVMTAEKIATNTYSGTLYQTRGPPFNAVPFNPAFVVANPVGFGTLTFTSPNSGTFAYTVNAISQTKAITREVFANPVPTCTFGAEPNLALATNFQDLWWNNPAGSESGWGINLTHQGNTIVATWFTYGFDGDPLWLVVTAPLTAPDTYTGTLYQTHGPAFSAEPFNPANVVATPVGTATFSFFDGNSATFTYTVNSVTQTKEITREVFVSPGTMCQ